MTPLKKKDKDGWELREYANSIILMKSTDHYKTASYDKHERSIRYGEGDTPTGWRVIKPLKLKKKDVINYMWTFRRLFK